MNVRNGSSKLGSHCLVVANCKRFLLGTRARGLVRAEQDVFEWVLFPKFEFQLDLTLVRSIA